MRYITLIILILALATPASAYRLGPATASVTTYAPPAPVSVVASAGSGQVTLTWSAGTIVGNQSAATSYDIYRSTSSGTETLWQSGKTSGYVDTGSNGTTYYYKIAAVNSAGSTLSSEVSATPTATVTAPAAPTGVTAVAGDASATVSFSASAGATSYTATSSPGGLTATGASSPLTVTGLTNGTAYTFTVVASNTAGPSAASAASNSVTPSGGSTYTATFDGTGAPDTGIFTVMTADSGTAALDGSGNLVITAPAVADAALVYRTAAITLKSAKTYKAKMRIPSSGISGTTYLLRGPSIFDASAKLTPRTNTSWTTANPYPFLVQSVLNGTSGTARFQFQYYDGSALITWDPSLSQWTTALPAASSYPVITLDTDYWIYLVTTTTGFQFVVKDAADSSIVTQTSTVLWDTQVRPLVANPWLVLGEGYTDYFSGSVKIDTYQEM